MVYTANTNRYAISSNACENNVGGRQTQHSARGKSKHTTTTKNGCKGRIGDSISGSIRWLVKQPGESSIRPNPANGVLMATKNARVSLDKIL
jgi:hypothetical protein